MNWQGWSLMNRCTMCKVEEIGDYHAHVRVDICDFPQDDDEPEGIEGVLCEACMNKVLVFLLTETKNATKGLN